MKTRDFDVYIMYTILPIYNCCFRFSGSLRWILIGYASIWLPYKETDHELHIKRRMKTKLAIYIKKNTTTGRCLRILRFSPRAVLILPSRIGRRKRNIYMAWLKVMAVLLWGARLRVWGRWCPWWCHWEGRGGTSGEEGTCTAELATMTSPSQHSLSLFWSCRSLRNARDCEGRKDWVLKSDALRWSSIEAPCREKSVKKKIYCVIDCEYLVMFCYRICSYETERGGESCVNN